MNKLIVNWCGLAALVMAGHAFAASQSWIVGSNYGPITSGLTTTAVSNTGAGTSDDTAASAANNGATQTIASATWTNTWGGIYNADAGTGTYNDQVETVSPEHSIDNNQRNDMALLSFTSGAVKLTSVTLGWSQYDSDITVLAYTGSGDPRTSNLTGNTYGSLVGLGWTLVGNYFNVGSTTSTASGSTTATINASGVYSSYWLIGAFNSNVTGNATAGDSSFDYVKLASVYGCIDGSSAGCTSGGSSSSTSSSGGSTSGSGSGGRVPEPGSLGLFGLAFAGLVARRKVMRP